MTQKKKKKTWYERVGIPNKPIAKASKEINGDDKAGEEIVNNDLSITLIVVRQDDTEYATETQVNNLMWKSCEVSALSNFTKDSKPKLEQATEI